MINWLVNRKWNKIELYFLYWTGYLLFFTIIEGLTDRDFFLVFRNELFSLTPKVIFVWVVVEKLTPNLLFHRRFARFTAIYILLMVVFAFVLRLVDNYIILKYFLTYWTKEPLLSTAPFLYNIVKLQFLLAIPFCVELYRHLNVERNHVRDASDNEKKFLSVKCDRRMVKILLSDICYFEAQGNYLMIFTINGVFKTYLSISELGDKLPEAMFARVHRSFVVALNKVESHTGSLVHIRNKNIPIGRSYTLKVRNRLS